MERERAARSLAARLVEQPFLEHEPGAVKALLAGLEHQEDAAGPRRSLLDEQPCGAEQHRDVRVVPAGVHPAVMFRGELEPGLLGQRQGVHVGPQQDGRPGPAAFDGRHDGADGDAGDGIEPESADRVEDDGLRPRQLQADLRDPMQSTPQRDHLGEDLACGVKVGVGDACRLHRLSMANRSGPDGTSPGERQLRLVEGSSKAGMPSSCPFDPRPDG